MNQFNNFSDSEIKVKVNRGNLTESVHRVHCAVSDSKGRILMKAGNSEYETFTRSTLKPFQSLPFINSGALSKISSPDKALAIVCGSHIGAPEHAREAFRILWESDINVNSLKCPIPKTKRSRLEHNCSGKHAGFLSTCKKMNWDLEGYLDIDHPLQVQTTAIISELLSITSEDLSIAKDDCGSPTFRLPISKIAFLYALLGSSTNAALEQVQRAITSNPLMLGGEGVFDSELTRNSHRQLLSKGGSEGVQCISRIGEGIGIAIKVEDGSKRAKHAVALHVLKHLDWITPATLKELETKFLKTKPLQKIKVIGNLSFQHK